VTVGSLSKSPSQPWGLTCMVGTFTSSKNLGSNIFALLLGTKSITPVLNISYSLFDEHKIEVENIL
jgi:hypothetical protein